MAAVAGLLGVRLEKKGAYALGDPDKPVTPATVRQAWRLVRVMGWLAVVLCCAGIVGLHLAATFTFRDLPPATTVRPFGACLFWCG